MPIKFIGSIILIAIVGIFCGFNWGEESRCSINLIFYKTPQIPVFLTIIVSFIAGMIIMALFSISVKLSKKSEEIDGHNAESKGENNAKDFSVKSEQQKTEQPDSENQKSENQKSETLDSSNFTDKNSKL